MLLVLAATLTDVFLRKSRRTENPLVAHEAEEVQTTSEDHEADKVKEMAEPSCDYPPVSIIVTPHDKAYELDQHLPLLLEQDYPAPFRIIVVFWRGESDTDDVLKKYAANPHLYATYIPDSSRYMSRKKLAITLGIKASKYDWLVFTEANCLPESDQWLRTMARNFTSRTQIVLGYSGYERGKGWLHKRASFDNLFTSMRYLGYALAGKPYMGIGRNMAYRKELFYAQKGFSAHLNLQRGDDDLFINKTATSENTRVETDANAIVRVQPVFRAKDWWEEKISYMATAHFYRGIQRNLSGFETTTRLLFHAAWIATLVIGILNFHWLVAGIAFLMFALRYTMQALIINKTAKDLGEKRRYFFTLPVFDILQPMQSLRWKLYCQFRKRNDFLRR